MIRYGLLVLALTTAPTSADVTINISGSVTRPTCNPTTTSVIMPDLVMGSTTTVSKDFSFNIDQKCVGAGAKLAFYANVLKDTDGNRVGHRVASTNNNVFTGVWGGGESLEFCDPGTPFAQCRSYAWDLTGIISLTAFATLHGSDPSPGTYVSTITATVGYP